MQQLWILMRISLFPAYLSSVKNKSSDRKKIEFWCGRCMQSCTTHFTKAISFQLIFKICKHPWVWINGSTCWAAPECSIERFHIYLINLSQLMTYKLMSVMEKEDTLKALIIHEVWIPKDVICPHALVRNA